jgi:fido (protein-threonine AMPylation protein)
VSGKSYYYFEFKLKINSERIYRSAYLGKELPNNLGEVIQKNFAIIAKAAHQALPKVVKDYFKPKSVLILEQNRFWYRSLHTEIFTKELRLFKRMFAVLFLLNSNKSEGSTAKTEDYEAFKNSKAPKTLKEIEVFNSYKAINYVFSPNFKWTQKSIKTVHALLLDRISPEIAGRYKKQNIVVFNQDTAPWEKVREKMAGLLAWFNEQKKTSYPPQLALEFHYRFEAIHPFDDGNGRVGRLILNAYLLEHGYMPVIFFTQNHDGYCKAISKARAGRKKKLAHYFLEQNRKTRETLIKYVSEGEIKGGNKALGQWAVESGRFKRF